MLDYINSTEKTWYFDHSYRYNGLTNGVNTMKKARKLVKVVLEIDESENIKIGFSSVTYRKDKDLKDERNEVNVKLKK